VVDLFPWFEDKGFGRTFVYADPATKALVRIKDCRLSFLVGGLCGIFQPKCFHWASLNTEAAGLASIRVGANSVI